MNYNNMAEGKIGFSNEVHFQLQHWWLWW